MAYGSIGVKTTRPVRDIDIVGYNDYFAMSLKALKGDPEARRDMTQCIAMQHSTILRHVLEFLETDLPVFGTMGNPMCSCNAGIEYLEEALFDIHVRSCYKAFAGAPWIKEHIVAHCNATYLVVLSWKSTGKSWEDSVGFVKLNGMHSRQWAEFHTRSPQLLPDLDS